MYKKGFTLIELLVVIAIIGILSSVVLASLNTARSKGANAVVKSSLANMRAQAAIFYDDNSQDYSLVCGDPKIVSMLENASSTGGGTEDCIADTNSWAAYAQLKVPESDGSAYWCANSTGLSKGLVSLPEGGWATSSCQ